MNKIIIMIAALVVACGGVALDVASAHSLLGKRALLLSAALPLERDECLAVADAALSSGASVKLLVPLPPRGEAMRAEASLQLLQQMQRFGFPRLMEELGFAFGGVAGQYGTGNRPRIEFQYVRADDVETLSLALSDADVLLLSTPELRLADASLERARFRLQRRALGFVVRRLRADRIVLRRDEGTPRLRWAWLEVAPSPS